MIHQQEFKFQGMLSCQRWLLCVASRPQEGACYTPTHIGIRRGSKTSARAIHQQCDHFHHPRGALVRARLHARGVQICTESAEEGAGRAAAAAPRAPIAR